MLFDAQLDILEDDIKQYERLLLDILLIDRTSRRNIIWGTDSYASLGYGYAAEQSILPDLITGDNTNLIQPRTAKTLSAQDDRTHGNAEVFTPSWICNLQNNLIDEQWFGRPNVFNTAVEKSWLTNNEKVLFPESGNRTWRKYVDVKRLEISCGEAPYLVSRYDSVTGELIPIEMRIGVLDRKLRIVNENTKDESEWVKWAERAFQSVYGYEYQGDNLLLARENLLITFLDYYYDRFCHIPAKKLLLRIARIISWNLWQMDGMKLVIPLSCKPTVTEDITLFGTFLKEEPCPGCAKGDIYSHSGVYCKVFDWRENASLPFISLVKGESK